MPQDIPLEASETLAFTPECLAGLENPPVFTLRTATTREKRFRRRMLAEEAVARTWSADELRKEMLKGLRELWGEDAFAANAAILEAYWQAGDDFELQKKDDPGLVWSYDPEIEAAAERLEIDVAQEHRPFARMRADNAYASECLMLSQVAVMVTGWTGFDLPFRRERGYLTIDLADQLREALGAFEERHNIPEKRGTAWNQLLGAALRRMFLDADEEKNSDAPSPCETPPTSSKANKASGRSPASASSTSIPEAA